MCSDHFRLEHGLVGERLVPVTRSEDATHVAATFVRRLTEEQRREAAVLHAENERKDRRVQELEVQLGRSIHRVDQAEAVTARVQREVDGLRAEVAKQAVVIRKLGEKNAAVIGEKRQLHNVLIGKHRLPAVHYRVDIDREDRAYETVLFVLDTFPHREQAHLALTEARRKAQQRDGRLKSVRLDAVAWRAVVQVEIDR